MSVLAKLKFTAPAVALALALPVSGWAQTFQPANLGNSIDHLRQTVSLPDLDENRPVAAVYCQADVSAQGITSNVSCYEKDGFDQLRDQTASAMTGRSLSPATVDGAPVPVRMFFRAIYSEVEGQDPVLLLPNLGNMQSKHGYYYSAPQERLDKSPWYEAYSANSWAKGESFFSTEGRLTRYIAIVDEKGEPMVVRRIEGSKANKRDAIELEKHLKQSRFIPGFAEGKPERMQYVAVLHFPQ